MEMLKNHRGLRIILGILCVLVIILVIAFLFIKLWPPFGGKASKEDQKDYAKRAENYKDGKFYNTGDFSIMRKVEGSTKNPFVSTKDEIPETKLPAQKPEFLSNPSAEDLTITWFGHSTVLIQMNGINILTDPVFSECASPVSMVGPKRFSELPITTEELPHIDVVLISHDHYDHLDYETIKAIDQKVDAYLVPLGVENHLERWGIDEDKVQNFAWWEDTKINGLSITSTPARHYSNRSITDRFSTLWGSWVLKSDTCQLYISGDSGYGTHYEEIKKRFGKFDVVLVDSGQYDITWPEVHMNPEEAYQAAKILEADVIMPIHWGAFKLANHPWDDPVERFLIAAKEEENKVVTPKIGQTMNVNNASQYTERWWRTIK